MLWRAGSRHGRCAAVRVDAEAAIHGTFNNGEDITRPRTLFQIRQRYQRLPDAKGREPEKWTTTLRADLWTGLGDGWKLYGRIDEPLVYSERRDQQLQSERTQPLRPGRPADRDRDHRAAADARLGYGPACAPSGRPPA